MNYSQFGQAEYILSIFERIGIDFGTCLEAGANKPGNISNAMAFIKNGWKVFSGAK